jgi:hypothetical protein
MVKEDIRTVVHIAPQSNRDAAIGDSREIPENLHHEDSQHLVVRADQNSRPLISAYQGEDEGSGSYSRELRVRADDP